MMNQFDDFQKLGKENMDATMKALGAFSMGAQQIAVESADYAKKSFEQSTATLEKLVGAKTLDKAIEINAELKPLTPCQARRCRRDSAEMPSSDRRDRAMPGRDGRRACNRRSRRR